MMNEKLAEYLPVAAIIAALAIVVACGTSSTNIYQVDRSQYPVYDISSCELIVNAATGDDGTADGSMALPYRSITNAIEAAAYGNIVCAMPGTYSAPEETFPIIVNSGIFLTSVMGSGSTIINGAADYGLVNAALVVNSDATVNEFTVQVPSSPDINVIHAGIYADDLRAYIVNNVISGVGLGHTNSAAIVVMSEADPVVAENELTANHDGIVTYFDSCPVIINNLISNNENAGLLALNSSSPNMGARLEPGGNTLTGNGLTNLYNNTLDGAVTASGNYWDVNCSTNLDGTIPQIFVDGPATDNTLCPAQQSNYIIENSTRITF